MKFAIYTLLLLLLFASPSAAEDGYRLWLRYHRITDNGLLKQYREQIADIHITGSSPSLKAAGDELLQALQGLLGKKIAVSGSIHNGSVLVFSGRGKYAGHINYDSLGKEGFSIQTAHVDGKKVTIITANTDLGALYGTFHFIRLLQTHQDIRHLSITSAPRIALRMLDHWDNLNRTVERGYAGISIWNWHTLPDYIDQRYIDYARANASIGINGTVLTNVNANALVLTAPYLEKAAALANTFRPYGIKVYLTARFSAPVEIGKLKTSNPLDTAVQAWWRQKTREIYRYIPDFGGFLVKANSEGQPGPQSYGATHADGANMLADAVAPFGGIVMWRAFVYSNDTPGDRFAQAYDEFRPLDGRFRANVLVQVKNGPVDFQPREPFHPLFGAMPRTPLMMEFQLTQEYLGFATHLVFLPPMFREVLDADTYAKGKGSTVAKVIDGSLEGHSLSGMAGVANIGNERNWTGHPFGQANWYALGRMSWDPALSSSQIADEWIRQTFGNEHALVESVRHIMLSSHEALVNYMTPLGLHHIMGYGHHYGPAPWYNKAPRADWNPVYFHKADAYGIGFNRTASGSQALAQYTPEVRAAFADSNHCPEKYLLWFHHVSWDHTMRSGRNLWEELCYKYYTGVEQIGAIRREWEGLKKYVDEERFGQVRMLLNIQVKEAVWWRNACVLYFQTFSRQPLPAGYEKPDHTLEYYMELQFPYAPGHG